MININDLVDEHLPGIARSILGKPCKALLRRLVHEHDLQTMLSKGEHVQGLDFIEYCLHYLKFSYVTSDAEREQIPATGRVLIVANHPIGSLDALALLKLIGDIRRDVKVVANQILMAIPHMQEVLLPVNNMQGNTERKYINNIEQHLQNEGAVIIFPSGEVSRMQAQGIRDNRWRSGFLRIANKTRTPILPVHIKARNSLLFYAASILYKPMSTLLLGHELFNKTNKTIRFHIGEIIPYEYHHGQHLSYPEKIALFKRHLYLVGSRKPLIFQTQPAIAHPEDRNELRTAIEHCDILAHMQDDKIIYLFRANGSSPIMRELGRLREISFRAVGEGTNQRRDIDKYDTYYYHIVLWDSATLEIIGAYRLIPTKELITNSNLADLYTASLFEYGDAIDPYLERGIELGRSFVQPKYWGKRSLDYLWYGIGAFLAKFPQYKYLFGPVSISNSLPKAATDLMIYFYKLYFGHQDQLAASKLPYQMPASVQNTLRNTFKGNDYRADFLHLKDLFASMGCSIPTLYKQYTELCEPGGVHFLAFNVDPNFNDCVDGLVLIDVDKIKARKFLRYTGIDRNQAKLADENSAK